MFKIKQAASFLLICFAATGCAGGYAGTSFDRSVTEANGGFRTAMAGSRRTDTSLSADTVYAASVDNEDFEFSTVFNAKDTSRKNNIVLASEKINNVIVYPGETFSYNETVGPTTKSNGYKEARIFIRGKKSKGYGGGVCQVSSTLYNAVLNAGLKVTERHAHSLPVAYVPKDRDAATSYGGIDFKFVNTLSNPIIIKSDVIDDTLTVSIEKAADKLPPFALAEINV